MARITPRRVSTRGGEILIRSLEPDDAAETLAAAREMFRTATYTLTLLDEFTMTEAEERAFIQAKAEAPTSIFIAALHEGRIIGSLAATGGAKRKIAHQALIGMGMVEPWRGKGVGRALLEAAIDWARAHPTLEMLTLGVYEENLPAVHLYTSLGFTTYGRLPRALRHADGSEHTNLDMVLCVKP
mgnify:FL=1